MKLTIREHYFDSSRKFILRPKFEKRLLKLTEEQQRVLNGVLRGFSRNKDNKSCFELLWNITCAYKTGRTICILPYFSSEFSFRYYENSEAPVRDQLPNAIIVPLLKELQYQRKKVRPDFMRIQVPGSCKVAFNSLRTALNDDISSFAVYEFCNAACHTFTEEEIRLTVELLKNPTSRFHGLETLKFSNIACSYLLDHASNIAKLISNIYILEVFWGNVPIRDTKKEQEGHPLLITAKDIHA